MSWFDKTDDIKTILNHLGHKVPESITNNAKKELENRRWSKEQIRNAEWE